MREFEAAVAEATREMVSSGELKKLISQRVRKSLAEIVDSALSSYSPFGKQVAEAVTSALSIDAKDLGLSGYNQVVLAIVRQRLDDVIETVGRKKMADELDKMLGENAPRSIKLSELVEQFKKWASDRHRSERECTIIFEPKGKFSLRWLYLDPQAKTSQYQCQFQFLLGGDDQHVTCCKLGGVDPKATLFLGVLYGFPKLAFQIYAAGTKVVIDQEEFDRQLPHECECDV